MSRIDEYRQRLRRLEAWEPFLLEESGLPGPRANLELLQAVAEEGSTPIFLALLEKTPDRAPPGSREEFLAACGATGLGESIARGDTSLWPKLRSLASDPRWRVREGVAMGLQRIGDRDVGMLIREVSKWVADGPLERRAAAAGLCEPRLLKKEEHAGAVIRILDRITASLEAETDRRTEEVRVLRQALGYCWSVAIVASPAEGKKRFERWAGSNDADIRWIVRENLRKKRLQKTDPPWVKEMAELSDSESPPKSDRARPE
ncbi:MAG: hypothetical protein C4521_00215 [Actinobacteria bacterium]|nr:MAG: hypothetical protein C4521_00215 [Actinomycetota bacterium]